jgi:hypothetical protein
MATDEEVAQQVMGQQVGYQGLTTKSGYALE